MSCSVYFQPAVSIDTPSFSGNGGKPKQQGIKNLAKVTVGTQLSLAIPHSGPRGQQRNNNLGTVFITKISPTNFRITSDTLDSSTTFNALLPFLEPLAPSELQGEPNKRNRHGYIGAKIRGDSELSTQEMQELANKLFLTRRQ